MDEAYLPKSLAGMVEHVFEEKAELDEAVGSFLKYLAKARRFGWGARHPDDEPNGPTNWDRVCDLLPRAKAEAQDLITAIERLAVQMVKELPRG